MIGSESQNKELSGLYEKLAKQKIDTLPATKEDEKVMTEIIKQSNIYLKKGDFEGYRKYLIHIKNELRSTNG